MQLWVCRLKDTQWPRIVIPKPKKSTGKTKIPAREAIAKEKQP